MLNEEVARLRREYHAASLDERDVSPDPIEQFAKWFIEARSSGVIEPNAMTLATVDDQGRPSARIVLMKSYGNEGFTFFTNYQSRKGRELAQNDHAAVVFYWGELERQVRIEGDIVKLAAEDSDRYYGQRPIGARIGAWASPQSAEIPERDWLAKRWESMQNKYGEMPPRPPHWGGYVLAPRNFEFWQGRPSRLHDRIVYENRGGQWRRFRLAP